MIYFTSDSKVPSSQNSLGTMIIHDKDENHWQVRTVHSGFFVTIIRPNKRTPKFIIINEIEIKIHRNIYINSNEVDLFNSFLDLIKFNTQDDFWIIICRLIDERLSVDSKLTEDEIPDD